MASKFDYVTVVELTAFRPTTNKNNLDEPTLEDFISRAEEMVNAYTGQVFSKDNVVGEFLTGDNSNWLQVSRSPIQKVLKVVIDGTLVEPTNVAILPGGRIHLLRNSNVTVFPNTDVGNVEVAYTYGYTEVPQAVKHATIIAAHIFAEGGDDAVVQSQTDGTITIASKVGEDLTMQLERALNVLGKGAFTTGSSASIPKTIQINAEQTTTVKNINR